MSSADEIAALRAENEALAAEIKAMKAALGVDKMEQASERKRLQVREIACFFHGCFASPVCEEVCLPPLSDC